MGKLLNQAEVAELLGVSPRTLEAWRADGRGPAFIRVTKGGRRGGLVRYRSASVEAWLQRHEVEPGDAAGAGA